MADKDGERAAGVEAPMAGPLAAVLRGDEGAEDALLLAVADGTQAERDDLLWLLAGFMVWEMPTIREGGYVVRDLPELWKETERLRAAYTAKEQAA